MVGGLNVMEVTDNSISQALEWIHLIGGKDRGVLPWKDAPTNGATPDSISDESQKVLSEREKSIASQILKEIQARLRFLTDVFLASVYLPGMNLRPRGHGGIAGSLSACW
mgnify:CR=1 FL=1